MSAMVLGDMTRALTNTSGTGSYQLGGTPTGFIAPLVAMVSGSRSVWKCESTDGSTWEIFEGVLTAGSPPTISRDRIITSSAGTTAAINWPDTSSKRITQVLSADWMQGSLIASGRQRLPSGLMLQWGSASGTSNGTATVIFPVTFPNAPLTLTLAGLFPSGIPLFASFNSLSASGFGLIVQNSSGTGVNGYSVNYLALGY